MFFEDLFYPGNPARREKLNSLRGDIVGIFDTFDASWNETISLLNERFSQGQRPYI